MDYRGFDIYAISKSQYTQKRREVHDRVGYFSLLNFAAQVLKSYEIITCTLDDLALVVIISRDLRNSPMV